MKQANLNNPIEIRTVGIRALSDALGPVDMVRFMQQYDVGYGDYTKEKQKEQDVSLDEIEKMLGIVEYEG